MKSLRTSESEIQAMKETLCDQQKLLQKLYNELDVEREASSTAASEALSMILRLQGEKAAVKMEANQYKRLAEEKICHAEEALAIFEDVIHQREMEIAYLEYQVQSYSYKLSSLGCSAICFCESKYPENLLQRNEKLIGNMGAQILLRRNSLPAIPLPKKGNPDLISEHMNYENKNQSSIVEKKFENPAVGDINSYWEQIKRLDERVREIADVKGVDSSNVRSRLRSSPLSDLAREAGATKSSQIQHPENLLENEAATNLSCCSSVHDVFEDSQIFESDEGQAGQIKQQSKLISKGSERLVCPESVLHRAIKSYVKDETNDVEQISLSTDLFRPVDEVAIDCHSGIGQPRIGVAETRSKFQQFQRMEIVEDDERNAADRGEETLKLLKEIKEQLNYIEAEIRSWKTKNSSPSYDLPPLTLTEAMLHFWL